MPLSCSALARSWRETILSRRAFATAWLDSHDLLSGISMRRSWSAKASYWSNSCSKSDLNHLILSMSTTRSLESWESCPTDVTDDAGVDCDSLCDCKSGAPQSDIKIIRSGFRTLESGVWTNRKIDDTNGVSNRCLNLEPRNCSANPEWQNLCKVVHYTHSSIQYALRLLSEFLNFWVRENQCEWGPKWINNY